MHLSHTSCTTRLMRYHIFFLIWRHSHVIITVPAIYSSLRIPSSTQEQHICITPKAWDQWYRKWNWHNTALSFYIGHSVVVELNMAAIIRSPLSLGRPSVVCPCLWWCRHCCQKKGHEPYISHGTCCIFCDVLMYYELNLTWSNIYRLILWPLWSDHVTYIVYCSILCL